MRFLSKKSGKSLWYIYINLKRSQTERGSAALSKLIFLRIYLLHPLSKIGTRRLQRFVVECLPGKALKVVTKCVDTMHNTSLEIFESKKRALAEGNEVIEDEIAQGKDLISVLCEIKSIQLAF